MTWLQCCFLLYERILANIDSICRGVISIHVDLDFLDINQCPAEFFVPNAFKNTAKCDFRTQYVSIDVIP